MEDYGWRQTLLESVVYFYKDRKYLSNLLRYTAGQDSFSNQMGETHIELLTKELLKRLCQKSLTAEQSVSLKIYVYGTVSVICEWLKGEFQMMPEELADIFLDVLPRSLKTLSDTK